MSTEEQTHLGIGIDTARYGHHVSFMDEQTRSATKAFHFTENADGYNDLRKAIDRLREKHPGVVLHIHIDAAGLIQRRTLIVLRQMSKIFDPVEPENLPYLDGLLAPVFDGNQKSAARLTTRCHKFQVFCFRMCIEKDFTDDMTIFKGDVSKIRSRVGTGQNFVQSLPDSGLHARRESGKGIGIDEEAARISEQPCPEIELSQTAAFGIQWASCGEFSRKTGSASNSIGKLCFVAEQQPPDDTFRCRSKSPLGGF